jgi:hypothetical protein
MVMMITFPLAAKRVERKHRLLDQLLKFVSHYWKGMPKKI